MSIEDEIHHSREHPVVDTEKPQREVPRPQRPPNQPPPIPPEKINGRALLEKWRYHWQGNVLAKRLGKKVYPRAVIVALVVSGGSFALAFQAGEYGANPAMSLSMSPVIFTSCFFGLLLLALQVIFPLFYAQWAYRTTFTQDESVRAAPFTFEDRLMGILIPGATAIAIYYGISTVLGVIPTIATWGMQPMMEGMGLLFATMASMVTNSLISIAVYSLLFTTVVIRRLIQHPEIGQQANKSVGYVAAPYLLIVALYIGVFCLIGIFTWGIMMVILMPQITAAAGGGTGAGNPTPGPGFMGAMQSYMILNYLITTIGMFGMTWIYYRILKGWWSWDISLAKSVLFENQPEVS